MTHIWRSNDEMFLNGGILVKKRVCNIIIFAMVVLLMIAGILFGINVGNFHMRESIEVIKDYTEDEDTTKTVIYHIEDEPVYIEIEENNRSRSDVE